MAPGSHGEAAYRERNRVERLFVKLKEFRRIATRYEKLKVTFLGIIHLALGFIRLRATFNVNRAWSYGRICYNSHDPARKAGRGDQGEASARHTDNQIGPRLGRGTGRRRRAAR